MGTVRHLLARRDLATLLCVATLLLKLLVPTGYMIASEDGRLALTLCSGIASPSPGPAPSASITMPGMHTAMAGHAMAKDHPAANHDKPEIPCAFAGLTAAALGAIDPALLVALAVFILAAGFFQLRLPAAAAPARLRPPPRAPPARL